MTFEESEEGRLSSSDSSNAYRHEESEETDLGKADAKPQKITHSMNLQFFTRYEGIEMDLPIMRRCDCAAAPVDRSSTQVMPDAIECFRCRGWITRLVPAEAATTPARDPELAA